MQPNRVGRLSYVRRIPADLRPFAGNQKVIRRSLGLRTTNQSDPAVIQAWNRAHEEAEALLHQAETRQAYSGADHPQAQNRRAADRLGQDRGRRLSRHRGDAAELPPLATAVRRHAGRGSQTADSAGEGERPA